MTNETLYALFDHKPFRAIVVELADGSSRTISKRENVLPLKSQFFLGERASDNFEIVQIEDVVSVEMLSPGEA